MFIPHTEAERDEMLKTVGVKRLEDLFVDVPAALSFSETEYSTRPDRNGSHC